MTSRRRSYLIILLAVLLAYAPAIHSGMSVVDDGTMIRWLHTITDWSFFRHFFPESGEHLYFRPLLTLTYVLDYFLWDASPLVMHLENVLLHLLNTFLVFELTRILLSFTVSQPSRLPLLAALLFGLHPLNVESVAWISGRTDLLCATFVFSSAIATLKFKQEGALRYLGIAIITLFLGFLTKEVAIAFLPGAVLILCSRTGEPSADRTKTDLIQAAAVMMAVVVLFFVYYFVRDYSLTSNSSRIGITLSVIFNDLYYALFVCLRAVGFYIKKIFMPFPLNFGIMAVDPLYELLAMPIVLFCFWLLLRRRLQSALFLAGLCLITPAFLIAFGQIAWTPYAERYLYLPVGFVIPAVVCYLGQNFSSRNLATSRSAVVAGIVLLSIMGSAVFYRAYLWRSDLRLLADTTEKSPMFKQGWNKYGIALYEAGQLKEALASFEKASSLFGLGYKVNYDINRAAILERLGREDEAITLLRQVVQRPRLEKNTAYDGLIELLEQKMDQADSIGEKEQLRREINDYREKREQ